ncbi:MAG: hypothetical protein ACR2NB_06210 [Solirubrobacteraceae bacterium]
MEKSQVRLPPGVREPFAVYVNGVRQEPGEDYTVRDGVLLFDRPLVKEGKLGLWKWVWGAFGIGQYGRNDEVDVAWSVDGTPRLAHALDIDPPKP